MRSAAGAFFVAPLAALVVMVAFWGAGMNSEWAAILPVFSLASVGVIAQIAAPISYFWMWFFGIPAHVLLKRNGLNRWHHYALTGLALGAGPPAFYLLYLAAYDGFRSNTTQAAAQYVAGFTLLAGLFGACGIAVASAFWEMAVRDAPRTESATVVR